jgi:hypothetical protein
VKYLVIHEAATVGFGFSVVDPFSSITVFVVGFVICYWGSGSG